MSFSMMRGARAGAGAMAGAFWIAGNAEAGGVTRTLVSSFGAGGASFLLGIFLGCSRICSAPGMPGPAAGALPQQVLPQLSQPQSRWNMPRRRPRSWPLPQ